MNTDRGEQEQGGQRLCGSWWEGFLRSSSERYFLYSLSMAPLPLPPAIPYKKTEGRSQEVGLWVTLPQGSRFL